MANRAGAQLTQNDRFKDWSGKNIALHKGAPQGITDVRVIFLTLLVWNCQ